MQSTASFTEVLDLKKIKVLGYTTDFNKCDCCGKENLKGTISILDLNTDCVMHFGTTCAASADKYDTLDAVKAVKKEINSAVRDYKEKLTFAWQIARKILNKKYGNTGYPDFKVLAPQFEIDQLMDDCEKWYTNPENKLKAYPGYNS